MLLSLALLLGFDSAAARTPTDASTEADAASVARSGSWYDPSHAGEGFIIQFIDDSQAVVYWFTFDENGAQRWFLGVGTASGNQLHLEELLITEGGVFGPGFDPDAVERIDVGELTITFDEGDGLDRTARADYVIDGVEGNQDLVRLTRPAEVAEPQDGVPTKSGSWFDPMRSGEGFAMEILPDGRPLAYWFTYDINGRQAWMVGVGASSVGRGSVTLDLLQPVGGRFGPDFDPDEVVRKPVGTARLGLSCEAGFNRFESTSPADFVDVSFDLKRLAPIGPGACEDPGLTNLLPIEADGVALPDHRAGRAFAWFLEVLNDTGPISDGDIRAQFSDAWLAQVSIGETRTFLQNVRSNYPAARYTDPVAVTSLRVRGVITADTGNEAFVTLETTLANGKINFLQVVDYGRDASVVSAADAALGLEGAADRFASLSAQPGLLLARIGEDNSCQPIVARNLDTPRSTASVFKIWILAGVADAVGEGALDHDQVVPLDAGKQVLGGLLGDQVPGIDMTIDELSTLMMGISDNTATDMLLALAGRNRIDGLHAEYGLQNPALMTPQLGISEQFHLFFSFPLSESQSYVDGSTAFRRQFLEERIVPLGAWGQGGGGGFNHESLFIDGAWRASPRAVCRAFARHRLHTPGSDEALLVERALQAQAAQPNVRERWDRVWYKGGGLISGVNGNLVLNHAFMVERDGERPYVLVGMSNDPAGNLDGFAIQSILGRLLELAAEL